MKLRKEKELRKELELAEKILRNNGLNPKKWGFLARQIALAIAGKPIDTPDPNTITYPFGV